ncbi:MAG: hypothetical protein A2297_09020 [Elusimicrobia bacterium RIFOXYB2_FULL_48_7]|nr:MAG: hypothetical protein A2297_09020 [Elusimicrobia bacterium RIFOXYB2_FULL_48_7]
MKTVRQLSIFAENKVGKIETLTKVFADNKINILAFNITSMGDFGVIKFVLDKPEEASKLLKKDGHAVSVKDILAIEMNDRPGGMYEVAKILGQNSVNIENAYVLVPKARDKALLLVEVTKINEALKALEGKI